MPKLTKAGSLLSIIRRELLAQSFNQHPNSNFSIRRRIVDRRSFIEDFTKLTLGAVSGIATLSSCNLRRNNADFSTVAILGGGIAGLSAALEFKDSDIDFKIFEASHQAGGRILTLYDVLGEGLITELGGEFIDTNHSDMFRLAEKFNLPLLDIQKRISDLDLIKDSFFFEGGFIDETVIVKEFARFSPSILKDITQLSSGNEQLFKEFDSLSISDYLRGKGISGWLYQLLNAAFTAEFGLDACFQSALNFLTMIDANPCEQFRLYGDSDERFTIEGGNQLLIKKMTDHVRDSVFFNHCCKSISYEAGRYQIEFSNSRIHCCQYLLIAIPFTALRKINIDVDMPLSKQKVINGLHYGTNSKIVFGTDIPLWKNMQRSGYLFSDFIQNGWDSSIASNRKKTASFTIFQGGASGRELEVSKSLQYLDALNAIFPA